MSIFFNKDGTELMLIRPLEFRRVYTLEFSEAGETLKYTHSDVLIELENGESAMIEIVQAQLPLGRYHIKFLPTDCTFDFRLSKGGEESMLYLKKLVFMNYPNLKTRDVYLNTDLERN